MNLSLNGLQRNTVESFSELIDLVKKSKRTVHEDIMIDAYEMQEVLESLRTDVVCLAAIIDPDTGKSYLDDESATIPAFEAEEEEEEEEEEESKTTTQ